ARSKAAMKRSRSLMTPPQASPVPTPTTHCPLPDKTAQAPDGYCPSGAESVVAVGVVPEVEPSTKSVPDELVWHRGLLLVPEQQRRQQVQVVFPYRPGVPAGIDVPNVLDILLLQSGAEGLAALQQSIGVATGKPQQPKLLSPVRIGNEATL